MKTFNPKVIIDYRMKHKNPTTGKPMSQHEFARLLNSKYQAQHVSNWELGKNKPDNDSLPLIAQAIGCKIDDLYTDDESSKGGTT